MAKEERILYLDVLRILSVFAVVVLHIAAWGVYYENVEGLYWQIDNLFNSLVRCCVPVLVMISGVFFLDPARPMPLRKLYGRHVKRVLTAFGFWSALYAVLVTGLVNGGSPRDVLLAFLKGHYHLWFLYMIVGLYVMTPLLRRISAEKRATEYFLVVALVLGYGARLCAYLPVLRLFVPEVLKSTGMDFSLGYIGYFFLGYYLHAYGVSGRVRWCVYALGILGVLFTAAGSSVCSLNRGRDYQELYDYQLLNNALPACAVFLFAKERMRNVHPSEKWTRRISAFSAQTFGIYLVHDFFNLVFKQFHAPLMNQNPLYRVPLLACGIFAASWLVSWLLSKSPVLRKWIL